MANNYLDFVTDEHFLKCLKKPSQCLCKSESKREQKEVLQQQDWHLQINFDAQFNNLSEKRVIEKEILRQIDKSINNSIGTFHEEILGGIGGYERGNLSGFDIKAKDNTLFADIKNKHYTMNSSAAEALFQKLARYANDYKLAKCYWVQILAKGSFNEHWTGDINGKEYSHSRVFKISGDQFYYLLTGKETAFFELYQALPIAIKDFMSDQKIQKESENSALAEIESQISESGRSIFNEITFENFSYYLGFDRL